MHRSGLGGVIIDCQTDDVERVTRFWSEALGLPVRGTSAPAENSYAELDTPVGQPYLEVQQVEHPSRVHLDIKTDDVEAEVRRLEGLGAKRVQQLGHWWVMEAPSGHRFCVVALHPGQDVGPLNTWDE